MSIRARGGPQEPVPYRSRIIGDLRLDDGEPRQESPAHGLIAPGEEEVPVILELNLRYPGGIEAVTSAFFDLFEALWSAARAPDGSAREVGPLLPELRRVTARLYQCVISRRALKELMEADAAAETEKGRHSTIFKAWPDYYLDAQIDRSAPTVKADAAWRSYAASGKRIVWAVIDSGIDASHAHFSKLPLSDAQEMRRAKEPDTASNGDSATFGLHRDFTDYVDPATAGQPSSPLTDEDGHGTHVAGIIAGACPQDRTPHVATSFEAPFGAGFVSREPGGELSGMAPECSLVSLKVLRLMGGTLRTSASAMIRALDYVQNTVNGGGLLLIHGVNISIGCEWEAKFYAAGQSPLCRAVNELVASGVVVVVSAGNGGTRADNDTGDATAAMGSITEPAHAEDCITVGSTHRDAPHAFGVTYTSSKGPTLDGRRKPDVVAPGEWITSAATGLLRHGAGLDSLGIDETLTYAEDSGTSMAAPHVSGVIAAFLSARPEFIGRPREIKTLLCESATDLGREPYAQGHGLVDLMRMLSNS